MNKGAIIQQSSKYAICPQCNGEGVWWSSGMYYPCKHCKGTGKVIETISYHTIKENV